MRHFFLRVGEPMTRRGNIPKLQPMIIAATAPLGLIALLITALQSASGPQYTPLIHSSEPAHLESVSQFLRERGYRYKIESSMYSGASSLLVEDPMKARAAIELADEGLLAFDLIAYFELLNNASKSLTNRQIDLQSKRAAENTLARYFVHSSQQITSAKVSINSERSSLSRRDPVESSAVVKIGYLGELLRGEARGIQRLTATMVEGLHWQAVEVVDRNGQSLIREDIEPNHE